MRQKFLLIAAVAVFAAMTLHAGALTNYAYSQSGNVICTSCQFENLPNTKFCANCGQKIEIVKICPSCKFENHPQAKFCVNCGTSIAKDLPKPKVDPKAPKAGDGAGKSKASDKPSDKQSLLKAGPAEFIKKGDELFAKKDYEKAKEEYKEAVAKEDKNVKANFKLGLSYLKAFYLDEAEKYLKKTIELDKEHVDAHYYMSQVCRFKNDGNGEQQYLKLTLEKDQNHLLALNNYAVLGIKSRNYEDAITLLKKATSINQNYYIAKNNLATALLYKNRFDDAKKALEDAQKINPDFYLIYYNMGVLFNNKNFLDDAVIQFDNVLKIKPDHIESYNNKGAVLNRMSKFKDAMEALKAGIEKNTNKGELHLNLAISYDKLSMSDEAVSENFRANQLVPGYNTTSYPNGIMLGAITEYDDESLEQVVNKSPKFAISLSSSTTELDKKLKTSLGEVHGASSTGTGMSTPTEVYTIGEQLFNAGKYEEAMAEFKKVIELKKDHEGAYEKMGLCFGALGKYDNALEFLDKAYTMKPDSASICVNYAKAYGAKGMRDKEVEMLNKAVKNDPKYYDAYYNLGLSYKAQGKKKEAGDAFKKYLELYPDAPKKDMIQSLIEQMAE